MTDDTAAPHGVEGGGKLLIPHDGPRVDTGVVQFGDDGQA